MIVSAGYGDYYSVLMTFDKEEIFKACKHDIQNLDLSKYEYKIIKSSPRE